MVARIVQWLIGGRYLLLALAFVLALVAYRRSTQLEFDRSIENMFAADDPLLTPFRKLKRTFGGNEIVLAVYQDEQLLDSAGGGLARLAEVSARLKQIAGVRDVLSLAEVNTLLDKLPGSPFARRVWKGPAILDPASELAARYRDLFAGYTHSHDGHTAALAVMLVPSDESEVPRRQTIDKLREAIEDLPGDLSPGMLAGEPVMVTDGFRYLEADGRRLGWSTTVLLALVIIFCFRSLRWVIISVAVVQWTLIVTQAVLAWSGLRLSMVSSMLSAIVTVVGIATVVHIIVVFREEMLGQSSPHQHPQSFKTAGRSPATLALYRAGLLLVMPIVWSCLTDAVGFGSLLAARLGPVQDFGLMTALGALLVLAAVALLVPSFALVGVFEDRPQQMWGEARIEAQLTRLITWVEHHPRPLLGVLIALSVVALVGSLRMEVETDFTKNFRTQSPVVRSYAFVETHLGGAGVWDVIVPAPPTLSEEYLERVRALEQRLRAITVDDPTTGKLTPALTKVLSLADVDQAAKASPVLASLLVEARTRAMQAALPAFMAALRSTKADAQGNHYLRIMLRASERQPTKQKKQMIAEVSRLAEEAFPAKGAAPAAEVTGFFVLLTHLIDSLLADQWLTFGVSTAGIGVMLLIALRDFKLALIAQVPNVLPIMWTLGLVGWLGMKMNMGAAMIAAVSLGLSVDSSIHYILAYQQARVAGQSTLAALHTAQQGVGRALVFSTLALIVGFSVLASSEFIPTVYFGVLVSLAMLGGLFGNLLVLPLLIRMTAEKE